MPTLDNILNTKLKFILSQHSLPYNISALDSLPFDKKLELILTSIDGNNKLLLFLEIWGCIRIVLMGYEELLEKEDFEFDQNNKHKHSEQIINSLPSIFEVLKKLLPFAVSQLKILQIMECCYKIYIIYGVGESLDFLAFVNEYLSKNQSDDKITFNYVDNIENIGFIPNFKRECILRYIIMRTMKNMTLFPFFAKWLMFIQNHITNQEKNILGELMQKSDCCYRNSLNYKIKKMKIKWDFDYTENKIINLKTLKDKKELIGKILAILALFISDSEIFAIKEELERVYEENKEFHEQKNITMKKNLDFECVDTKKNEIKKTKNCVIDNIKKEKINQNNLNNKENLIEEKNNIKDNVLLKKNTNHFENNPNMDLFNAEKRIFFYENINNLKLKINQLEAKTYKINNSLIYMIEKIEKKKHNIKNLVQEKKKLIEEMQKYKQEIAKKNELINCQHKNTYDSSIQKNLKQLFSEPNISDKNNAKNHFCEYCGQESIKMTPLIILPKENHKQENKKIEEKIIDDKQKTEKSTLSNAKNQKIKFEYEPEIRQFETFSIQKKNSAVKTKKAPQKLMKKKEKNPFITKLQSLSYKNYNFYEKEGKINIDGYDEAKIIKYFEEIDFNIFIQRHKINTLAMNSQQSVPKKTIFDHKKSMAISIALSRIKQSHITTIDQIYTFRCRNENLLKQLHEYYPTEIEIKSLKENQNSEMNTAELFFVEVHDSIFFYECIVISLFREKLLSDGNKMDNDQNVINFNNSVNLMVSTNALYRAMSNYIQFFIYLQNDDLIFLFSLKLIKFILSIITKKKNISILKCLENEDIIGVVEQKIVDKIKKDNLSKQNGEFDKLTSFSKLSSPTKQLKKIVNLQLINSEILKTEFSELMDLLKFINQDMKITITDKKIVENYQMRKKEVFDCSQIIKDKMNEMNKIKLQTENIIGEKLDENEIQCILAFYENILRKL